MCGRYTLAKPLKAIESHFGPLHTSLEYRPSYNIAPSLLSPVVINNPEQRELTAMKWGLVPSWAKDEKMKLINARSETAHEKPSFKNSLRSQRCLIPADGFIEWRGTEKQPCYIYLKDQALFGFAGLWSTWKNLEGVNLNTYSILTTEANEKLAPIHARMPVILPAEQYETWLAPDSSLDALRSLLTAYPSEEFGFHPVSKEVNSPKNNLPEILQSL
jgi:putative SOS response-associated peptidase YedK